MQPAHAGLSPRPLPGGGFEIAAPATTIARVEPPSQDGGEEPQMQNNGFFESIGNLFGSNAKDATKKQKTRRMTAQERMKRAQEEH